MDAGAPSRAVQFGTGLARAFAGAVLFGLPLLMTMEMWSLGSVLPPWKLALLLAFFLPVLVLLSWHAGFEPTFSWRDDVVDALVAYAVGCVSSGVVLWMFGLLAAGDAPGEIVGKLTLQAVPASIGALLAQTQLGERDTRPARRPGPHYASELFIMGVGALFLAFNIAPTEEMPRIAVSLPRWGAVVLLLASLALMHAFVYSVSFRGAAEHRGDTSFHSLFLRYTVAGYAVVLLLSAGMLWCFGRLDGLSAGPALRMVVVLGFPGAVGAAAARLIL